MKSNKYNWQWYISHKYWTHNAWRTLFVPSIRYIFGIKAYVIDRCCCIHTMWLADAVAYIGGAAIIYVKLFSVHTKFVYNELINNYSLISFINMLPDLSCHNLPDNLIINITKSHVNNKNFHQSAVFLSLGNKLPCNLIQQQTLVASHWP